MAFDDRLQYLLLGMAIGFVLGYLVRLVRDIKEELDKVDEIVERELGGSDYDGEKGSIKLPHLRDVAIFLVVGLTAYAAFMSQKASNDSSDAQDRIERVVYCNQSILSEALTVLNERSSYTKAAADANIDLQQSQSNFFSILLHRPPYSEAKRSQAVQDYYHDLKRFLRLANKSKVKNENNPYPTNEEFSICLNENRLKGSS